MKIKFGKVEVGERFHDSSINEDLVKICGNTAEILRGGNYHSNAYITYNNDNEYVFLIED